MTTQINTLGRTTFDPIPIHHAPRSLRERHGLDKDKVAMVPRQEAARVAMAALSSLQDERPETIVLGAAVLFAAMCSRCGVDARDVHEMAKRVINSPMFGDRSTDATLEVLRDFAGARVMGQEVSIG